MGGEKAKKKQKESAKPARKWLTSNGMGFWLAFTNYTHSRPLPYPSNIQTGSVPISRSPRSAMPACRRSALLLLSLVGCTQAFFLPSASSGSSICTAERRQSTAALAGKPLLCWSFCFRLSTHLAALGRPLTALQPPPSPTRVRLRHAHARPLTVSPHSFHTPQQQATTTPAASL